MQGSQCILRDTDHSAHVDPAPLDRLVLILGILCTWLQPDSTQRILGTKNLLPKTLRKMQQMPSFPAHICGKTHSSHHHSPVADEYRVFELPR